jgi:hypothetical protein
LKEQLKLMIEAVENHRQAKVTYPHPRFIEQLKN